MNDIDNSDAQENSKKILVMGLDNSGKTSIVYNMLGKDNILEFLRLNPTKGYTIQNIKKKNSTFILWDLGGQDASKQDYMDNFQKYIIGTEEIFFVIDVQNVDKYDEAINYLKKIIEKLKATKYDIEITIFLHKNDHDLFKNFPNLNEMIIENLIIRLKEIIPSNYYCEIYKTTIYTVLDKIHVY